MTEVSACGGREDKAESTKVKTWEGLPKDLSSIPFLCAAAVLRGLRKQALQEPKERLFVRL